MTVELIFQSKSSVKLNLQIMHFTYMHMGRFGDTMWPLPGMVYFGIRWLLSNHIFVYCVSVFPPAPPHPSLPHRCSCVCDENYTGDTCETLCDKTCDPDHGTLDPVMCTCQCEPGYYGETCSSELALSSGDGGGITAGAHQSTNQTTPLMSLDQSNRSPFFS